MAANSILKLRVDSQEYDAKLKKAAEGLQHLAKAAHDCGGDLINLEKDEVAFIREMGSMNTSAKTAAGSIREMESTLKVMTLTYKQMSDAEKSGNAGKALADAMTELRSRLVPAKQALAETEEEMRKLNQEVSASQSPFGRYGSIIDNIGSRFGITGNLSEMLTSKTAMLTAGIGAATAIVGKATQEWAKYNAELAKQDQITTVTTGLKGADSDRMTDQARAMVDTYGVDFREAINAANTLMTQFGQTGEQAMSLISDGMQGMIQGDGPKLLSMIQQYAPSFRDAGVSASQLVAVIQNSEGGIFTDQNMNAIVMGIKNIRLMTKATSDALKQMGIDGDLMSKQLSDGTLTVFDALKQVAGGLQNVDSNSKVAGDVMQQVFGRQGVTAGTNLGKAIEQLNINLGETKKQTGEVGDAYNDLYNANVKLNGAIRDCFEYDGWDQMATGIKANLVSALASVLDLIGKIKGALGGFSVNQQQGGAQTGGGANMDRMIAMLGDGKSPKAQQTYTRQIQEYSAGIFRVNDQIRQIQEKAAQDMDGNMAVVYEKQIRNLENRKKAIQRNMAEYDKRAQAVLNGTETTPPQVIKPTPKGKTTKTEKTEIQQNDEQIASLTKEYLKLKDAASTASAEQQADFAERMADIKEEIDGLQKRNEQLRQWTDEAKGGNNEIQQNDNRIKLLTADYKKVSDIAKTATGDELKNAQTRQQAIQTEIKTLQDRNKELRLYEQQARGEAPEMGSQKQLQQQLSDLQQRQSLLAPDTQGWRDLQKEIDATARQLDIVQGKIPKGEQAVITFTVKKDELDKTMANLPKDKNVKVNVETVEPKPVDVKVNEPKSVDVKVNEPKSVDVKVNEPKPVDVKVNEPKPVDVKVNEPKPVDVKVNDPKDVNVKVNVETVGDIDDLTDEDRTVHYHVETDGADLTDLTDEEKTVIFRADTREALQAAAEIQGISIDPKDVVFVATDAGVIDAVRGIEGVKIDPKTLTVTAQTSEAMRQLMQVQGLTFDPKTVNIIANTQEAQQHIQALNNQTIKSKTVDVKANEPKPVDIKVNEPKPVDIKVNEPKPVEVKTVESKPVDVKVNEPAPIEQKVDVTVNDQAIEDLNDSLEDREETVSVSIVTSGQESLEALKKQLDNDLGDRKYTITYETKVIDTKAFNTQNIDAFLADAKNKIKEAEIGSVLYDKLTEQIKDANSFSSILQEMTKKGISTADFSSMKEMWQKALSGENIPDSAWEELVKKINDELKKRGLNPITFDVQSGKASADGKGGKSNPYVHQDADGKLYAKMNEVLGGLAGGMSQVVGGLEQLGIEVPQGIKNVIGGMQGIATILTGIASIVSAIQAITMVNTFKLLHNGGIVPHFADGGLIGRAASGMMIPGNHPSGDMLRMPVDGGQGWIGVNSGELILNRSQQGILAGQLEQARQESYGGGTPYVQGELIYLGVNNFLKRSGRGEIVTSKRG